MSLPLILNHEAEADPEDAKSWYDGHQPGLGNGFLQAVHELLVIVQKKPSSTPGFFKICEWRWFESFPSL